MSPLEFLQRLAALVPRPRLNLIRYFGVLAPNAKWRGQVVPKPRDEPIAEADEVEAGCRGASMSWAHLLSKILRHLSLPARAPPKAPARYPAFFEPE